MRSAWWWGTPEWEAYQVEYYKGRERPEEYKTSPLASDHEFDSWFQRGYVLIDHQTQVVDLTVPVEELWRGVRASYHSIIHRAQERYEVKQEDSIMGFRLLHHEVFGRVRSEATFICQQEWKKSGNAMVMVASKGDMPIAAAYWIVYQGKAYYASGPAVERNVQHAVIWDSLLWLKANGVTLAELGQIDGETEKERNVGKFKTGFGGTSVPFTVARRVA